jgi:hypothetical protein
MSNTYSSPILIWNAEVAAKGKPAARVPEATVEGGAVACNGYGVVTVRGSITAVTATLTLDVWEWDALLQDYCLREQRTVTDTATFSEDFILGACTDTVFIGTSALDATVAAYSMTAQMKSPAL